MKRIFCVLLILSLFLTVSCVARVANMESYQNEIEKIKNGAIILAKLSPFQISYLKAVIGNDINNLPLEASNCLDNILNIVEKAKQENRELTDEELGFIAGKWDRFVYLIGPKTAANIISIVSSLVY